MVDQCLKAILLNERKSRTLCSGNPAGGRRGEHYWTVIKPIKILKKKKRGRRN
jgi:hypothetical protein